jgi:hypothetical protein
MARTEPAAKRVVAYVDGQSLFHSAKEVFHVKYPNYDPWRLAEVICSRNKDWSLAQLVFYTGVPMPDSPKGVFWNHFWFRKLAFLTQNPKIRVVWGYTRPSASSETGFEREIDPRISMDIAMGANSNAYDIALLFSQDFGFRAVALKVREISKITGRWIKITSAFPYPNATHHCRGIPETDWIKIDEATYNSCLDTGKYGIDQGPLPPIPPPAF